MSERGGRRQRGEGGEAERKAGEKAEGKERRKAAKMAGGCEGMDGVRRGERRWSQWERKMKGRGGERGQIIGAEAERDRSRTRARRGLNGSGMTRWGKEGRTGKETKGCIERSGWGGADRNGLQEGSR